MHDNAAIASAVSETTLMLNTVLGLQAKSASGDGKSWDEMLEDLELTTLKKHVFYILYVLMRV